MEEEEGGEEEGLGRAEKAKVAGSLITDFPRSASLFN